MYEDFTTNRYGNGTQVFHDNVVIGANKIYIYLHKIILVTTRLDLRMKELSPFLNDNNMEATFEYLLGLTDDDLDKVSGIDSGIESKINEETIDKYKCLDESGEFFSELSMDNDNQREIICENNEICNAELN